MNNIKVKLTASSILLTGVLGVPQVFAEQQAWQLQNSLNLPQWLQLTFQHRTRYETLDQQFRNVVNGQAGDGGDQAIVFRTLVHAKLDFEHVRVGAEMMDSRITLADAGTASNSSRLTANIVNPVELLQAYIEVPMDNWLMDDSQSLLRAGRLTIDAGSRRLIARNRYRNTINSFTGAEWKWQAKGRKLQAFYTMPVRRLVKGGLRNNTPRFDREYTYIRFWGLYYSQPLFSQQDKAETFVLGLNEKNTADWQTRERELYTFGWRLWHQPEAGQLDYQFEGAYQLGESKASNTSMTTLDHWAYFHHAEVGYSFSSPWSPRAVLQYDYASGDENPNDGKNNRFDTLYGARRFDFGPTSIYGSFARNNINSPAARLSLKPHPQITSMMALRGFWRASTSDSWTGAGINGRSPYIGTQLEARLRYQLRPGNVSLEAGVAHLFAGDLMDEAGKEDSTLSYVQATFKF